jgi:hypothetical protein
MAFLEVSAVLAQQTTKDFFLFLFSLQNISPPIKVTLRGSLLLIRSYKKWVGNRPNAN